MLWKIELSAVDFIFPLMLHCYYPLSYLVITAGNEVFCRCWDSAFPNSLYMLQKEICSQMLQHWPSAMCMNVVFKVYLVQSTE